MRGVDLYRREEDVAAQIAQVVAGPRADVHVLARPAGDAAGAVEPEQQDLAVPRVRPDAIGQGEETAVPVGAERRGGPADASQQLVSEVDVLRALDLVEVVRLDEAVPD